MLDFTDVYIGIQVYFLYTFKKEVTPLEQNPEILEQLKVINQQLAEIKNNQASLDQKVDELQIDMRYIIAKLASLNGETFKRTWKPYIDTEAMFNYCSIVAKHPTDLTWEEKKRFRINREE